MSSANWRPFCLGLRAIKCEPCAYFLGYTGSWELGLIMMTASNGNIFRVTGHLCGQFTGLPQMSVTRSFDIFFDLRLNKRLSKQSWGWWFETLSCPLWRQCNVECPCAGAFFISDHLHRLLLNQVSLINWSLIIFCSLQLCPYIYHVYDIL